jgi:hypothetical protein
MTRLTLFFIMAFTLLGLQGKAQTALEFDTLNFEVTKAKRKIPCELFSAFNIESISSISGRFGFFRKGCTGIGKSKRLNWLAIDNKGHYVISISTGGRAFMTTVYYYDTKNKSSKTISVNAGNKILNIKEVLRAHHD